MDVLLTKHTMPQVLCLGEILVDQIAVEVGVSRDRISAWTPYPGGAPANVACGLAKLGTSSGFIGCVGNDQIGQELVQLLKTESVDTTGVQVHPNAPTRQVYVTRSPNGERAFSHFSGEASTVFADTLLSADLLPAKLFEDADFLVLGTLGLASEITSQAIARSLKLAEDNFVRVVVDINWRPIFWSNPMQAPNLMRILLSHTDFLKVSAEEAEWLFHTTSPVAIAQTLNHLEGVIVTNGNQDCRYYLGDRQGKRSAFAVDSVDTTGAGDAFLAGLLHQLCHRPLSDLDNPAIADEIITYANAVGAIATLKMGAIASQPTDAQVKGFLAQAQS